MIQKRNRDDQSGAENNKTRFRTRAWKKAREYAGNRFSANDTVNRDLQWQRREQCERSRKQIEKKEPYQVAPIRAGLQKQAPIQAGTAGRSHRTSSAPTPLSARVSAA